MRPALRLIAVLAALLVPGSLLARWMTVAYSSELVFNLDRVPSQLAGYARVSDDQFEPAVLAQINPDAYMLRLYGKAKSPPIWAYIALYRGRGSTAAHTPAACYPAQGWEIVGARDLDLAMENGGTLRARLLEVMRHGHKRLVLYWFQPVGRWPTSVWLEQILRVYDGLVGTPQYGFVRLSLPVTADGGVDQQLTHFARAVGPRVREVLERAKPRSAEAIRTAPPQSTRDPRTGSSSPPDDAIVRLGGGFEELGGSG